MQQNKTVINHKKSGDRPMGKNSESLWDFPPSSSTLPCLLPLSALDFDDIETEEFFQALFL
jgi:hypothetical protein